MKILALSDIHGDKHWMQEMAERGAKEHVDLVILAGDLVDRDGSSIGLLQPFKDKNLEVVILPGNHEGLAETYFMTEHFKVKHLHGKALQKGDIGIFGCGYADVGPHQLLEEDFFKTLQETHEQVKKSKKKIMVTHIQPSGSILGLGVYPGSTGVRKAIEDFQPDIHICGHVHETEGIEEVIGRTRVINVGKKGKIIEV